MLIGCKVSDELLRLRKCGLKVDEFATNVKIPRIADCGFLRGVNI